MADTGEMGKRDRDGTTHRRPKATVAVGAASPHPRNKIHSQQKRGDRWNGQTSPCYLWDSALVSVYGPSWWCS